MNKSKVIAPYAVLAAGVVLGTVGVSAFAVHVAEVDKEKHAEAVSRVHSLIEQGCIDESSKTAAVDGENTIYVGYTFRSDVTGEAGKWANGCDEMLSVESVSSDHVFKANLPQEELSDDMKSGTYVSDYSIYRGVSSAS